MGKKEFQFCADAGGKYCPCHLGHSGDCIKCNLINGEKSCDCKWQGVCVYDLLKHDRMVPAQERKETKCKIIELKEIEKNIYHLKILVPQNIIKSLCEPGSYVFLKDKDKENSMYNVPISVMDIDEKNSILEVILVPRGVKTKPIVKSEEVIVKAPYFNGIFGLKEIKSCQEENCVIVLDGLSQVNAVKVIKRLLLNHNNVEVFINENGKRLDIIEGKIMDLGVNISYFNLDEKLELLKKCIEQNNIKFIYSCGLIPFNKEILKLVDSIDENIKFAIPNNNLICCGEGICGACTVRLNNCRVKTCKAQIDGRYFLNNI